VAPPFVIGAGRFEETDMNDQPVQTMAAQGLVNRVMRGVLRTPLLAQLAGRRLVTLYVVGRKSGRHYDIPVAYTRHQGDLLVGTPFGWSRNLRTGEPIEIRLNGRRRPADVQVIADEPGVVDAYAVMARDNHAFAKFNHIGFGPDGDPLATDLHQACAAGARAFRLTPR
jgi:F420H(2)-dependent quinone reductase